MADKRVRMDKDALESLLFKLFERKASEDHTVVFVLQMRRKSVLQFTIFQTFIAVSKIEHWWHAVQASH